MVWGRVFKFGRELGMPHSSPAHKYPYPSLISKFKKRKRKQGSCLHSMFKQNLTPFVRLIASKPLDLTSFLKHVLDVINLMVRYNCDWSGFFFDDKTIWVSNLSRLKTPKVGPTNDLYKCLGARLTTPSSVENINFSIPGWKIGENLPRVWQRSHLFPALKKIWRHLCRTLVRTLGIWSKQ